MLALLVVCLHGTFGCGEQCRMQITCNRRFIMQKVGIMNGVIKLLHNIISFLTLPQLTLSVYSSQLITLSIPPQLGTICVANEVFTSQCVINILGLRLRWVFCYAFTMLGDMNRFTQYSALHSVPLSRPCTYWIHANVLRLRLYMQIPLNLI